MKNIKISLVTIIGIITFAVNAQTHTGLCFIQATGSPITTGNYTGGIATGDFNNDGKQDFIVCVDTHLSVYLGVGDGTFTAGVHISASYPSYVAVGDFNGDGKKDITFTSSSTLVCVCLGNGIGGFGTATVYNNINYNSKFLAVTDINKDGKQDIIVESNINYFVFVGNGLGAFTVNQLYMGHEDLSSFCVGDVNGDANPDIIFPTGSANPSVVSTDLAFGDGAGNFNSIPWNPLNSYFPSPDNGASHLALGDFNEDNKVDVAQLIITFGSPSNVSQSLVFIGLNSGVNGAYYSTSTSFATGANPNFIGVGDFNADNHQDLVIANTDDNNISILVGDGHGNFAAPVNFAVGTNPTSLAITDFNNDGYADIAISNSTSNNVTILLNALPKIITPPVSVCIGNSTNLVANVTGVDTYTYLWSNGATTLSTAITSPASSASYNFTATNSTHQCSTTNSAIQLTVNPLPTAFTVNSATTNICSGTKATLSVHLSNIILNRNSNADNASVTASGTTYSWAPAVGLNTTAGTSVIANPPSTTTYTITATTSAGCTYTTTATVTVVGFTSANAQFTITTGALTPPIPGAFSIQATHNTPVGANSSWFIQCFSNNGSTQSTTPIPNTTFNISYPTNTNPVSFPGYDDRLGYSIDPTGQTPSIGRFTNFGGTAAYVIKHSVWSATCPTPVTYTWTQCFCYKLANPNPSDSLGLTEANIFENYTGITNNNVNNTLILYPNPANNSFVIETNSADKKNLLMFDINGKLVLTQTISGTTTINTSDLNEGIYNISIVSNEGVINKRIAIIR